MSVHVICIIGLLLVVVSLIFLGWAVLVVAARSDERTAQAMRERERRL
jgi:hypothetical protein